MRLRWGRSVAKPMGAPGDEPTKAGWRVVFEGYEHTAARHDDDDRTRILRTRLGDVLFALSLALVREAALRKRCRELEDERAKRGEP